MSQASALKAHVHRLCYALEQFSAFDGQQTVETADLWVSTRGRADRTAREALEMVQTHREQS